MFAVVATLRVNVPLATVLKSTVYGFMASLEFTEQVQGRWSCKRKTS